MPLTLFANRVGRKDGTTIAVKVFRDRVPRRQRTANGGFVYHVLNRAVGRARIFVTASDYEAFERVLGETKERVAVRLLAYCVMPNHWHLVLWPHGDGELSEFMRLLTVTHVQRWHAAHGTSGTGALYQGRFKAFPVEEDDHLVKVWRYVERNALRAGLVKSAQDWRWCSAWRRAHRDSGDTLLEEGPLRFPQDWLDLLNSAQSETELKMVRDCVRRGSPCGDDRWRSEVAYRLGLTSSLRLVGRPRRK